MHFSGGLLTILAHYMYLYIIIIIIFGCVNGVKLGNESHLLLFQMSFVEERIVINQFKHFLDIHAFFLLLLCLFHFSPYNHSHILCTHTTHTLLMNENESSFCRNIVENLKSAMRYEITSNTCHQHIYGLRCRCDVIHLFQENYTRIYRTEYFFFHSDVCFDSCRTDTECLNIKSCSTSTFVTPDDSIYVFVVRNIFHSIEFGCFSWYSVEFCD